jgi:hypothetical protein
MTGTMKLAQISAVMIAFTISPDALFVDVSVDEGNIGSSSAKAHGGKPVIARGQQPQHLPSPEIVRFVKLAAHSVQRRIVSLRSAVLLCSEPCSLFN